MKDKPQSKKRISANSGKRLIISTKEARKMLGAKYSHLKDDCINDMIMKLDLIAQGIIKSKDPSLD